MHPARYWRPLEGGKVQCLLCPRRCIIPEGKRGYCGVRENRNGCLYTLVYNKTSGVAIDPIEKKPLYHFWPNSYALSIGTVGCNFGCVWCQNWHISRAVPEGNIARVVDADGREYTFYLEEFTAEDLVSLAKRGGFQGVSYTYNEPTVFLEYALDLARVAKDLGLYNTFVTNGYIEELPLREVVQLIDAANVDLKMWDREKYKKYCNGDLDAVLRTIKYMKKHGMWVEVTTLVVPTVNDDLEQIRSIANWIATEIGKETPLHLTRFFPHYKFTGVGPTPEEFLIKARDVAMDEGLYYVYIGNIISEEYNTTYCPSCGSPVIKRFFMRVISWDLEGDEKKGYRCKSCGAKVHVVGKAIIK